MRRRENKKKLAQEHTLINLSHNPKPCLHALQVNQVEAFHALHKLQLLRTLTMRYMSSGCDLAIPPVSDVSHCPLLTNILRATVNYSNNSFSGSPLWLGRFCLIWHTGVGTFKKSDAVTRHTESFLKEHYPSILRVL